MSVVKKKQTKKPKTKSPKASEKKIVKKQLKKSSTEKKTSATKKKTLPKNKSSAKESKPTVSKSKVSEKKLKDGFLPDQYVVYPSHGVGRVIEIEKREIAGQMLEMYVIEFEKEKMTQRVPIEKIKENGVRNVSTKNQLKEIFEILTGKAKIRRTMWSRRAQEYETKINSGDIRLLSDVVRDLFRKDDQTEQSYSERQMFQVAFERYTREYAISYAIKFEEASEKILEILNNR